MTGTDFNARHVFVSYNEVVKEERVGKEFVW
jgi:hypothetical protein